MRTQRILLVAAMLVLAGAAGGFQTHAPAGIIERSASENIASDDPIKSARDAAALLSLEMRPQ